MKVLSSFLIVVGIIAVIVFFTLLTGYVLFSLTPDMKSQIQVGQVTAPFVKSFNSKIDIFRKGILEAAILKQKKEFTLSVSEDELNSKVVEMLAEDKLPYKDLKLEFRENLCWFYFVLENPGANAKVGLVVKPEALKNDIVFKVIDFQLGKLPLPDSTNKKAEEVLNIFLKIQSPLNDLPVEVKSVEISNKQFIIKVTSKPAD